MFVVIVSSFVEILRFSRSTGKLGPPHVDLQGCTVQYMFAGDSGNTIGFRKATDQAMDRRQEL